MNWIKKIFSKNPKKEKKSDHVLMETDSEVQKMIEKGCEKREQFLATLGQVDSDVIAPLMNPAFMGGPTWPSFRQSWRVVRREKSTLISSDGLTDPFEEEKIPLGFKIEVYADTQDEIAEVHGSWLLNLVYTVSQIIAQYGNIDQLLEQYNSLSTVAHIDGLPDDWVNSDGNAGILIGSLSNTISNKISLDEGNVKFYSIKLLHPKELEFIESGGVSEEKRNQLISLFEGNHFSSLERQPVV